MFLPEQTNVTEIYPNLFFNWRTRMYQLPMDLTSQQINQTIFFSFWKWCHNILLTSVFQAWLGNGNPNLGPNWESFHFKGSTEKLVKIYWLYTSVPYTSFFGKCWNFTLQYLIAVQCTATRSSYQEKNMVKLHKCWIANFWIS